MNQGLHRLVFDTRRGMRVAVFEGGRRRSRAASGRRHALATAVLALLGTAGSAPPAALAQTRPPVVFAGGAPAPTNPRAALPQPYGTQLKADGVTRVNDPALRSFVANPAHRDRVRWTVSPDGRSAVLDQGDVDRVILNWDSFDIGAGRSVEFRQNPDPTRYVSALNRVWSLDPTLILGSLKANRELILVNANGVYFGRGAQVDTGKFVASSLGIADAVFEQGLRNVRDGSAVFTTAGTDHLPTALDSAVTIEAGAEIRSAAGGDVLLIAPRVANQGRIDTPQGQAVLAAGDRVYLMSSSDPAQRGLIVAVDPVRLPGAGAAPDPTLGIVENTASGRFDTAGLAQKINEIRADSGTVNLVGLLVRQAGQINATTAVKGANGSIQLQAMDATVRLVGGPEATTPTSQRGLVVEAGASARVSASGGTVELAPGSETRVTPSTSGATQLAAEVFNPSIVRIEGESVRVAAGARVEAPGGRIELLAASNRATSPLFNAAATFSAAIDGSHVLVEPGARLSTAGLRDVAVDGSRFQGSQRLFRIELADAPVQRDGPLYRQEVFFDTRDAARIGVANVTGATASTGFTAAEKSTTGGTLRLESQGAMLIGQEALLDVSGGSISVSAATLQTSQLAAGGGVVAFSAASAGSRYDALLSDTRRTPVPAYREGADGGQLVLNARRLALAGQVEGEVLLGERQREGTSALPRPAALTIGRFVGGGQYLAGLTLQAGAVPPLDPALLRAPSADAFAALPADTPLSLQAVAAGGFGALNLRATQITQPATGTLDLGLAGQLDLLAARLSLDGVFTAPGGSISLVTNQADALAGDAGLGDIRLSAATRLDTAGLWTNDTAAAASATRAPLRLDGGRVSVTAARNLLAEPGAELDVSGGARLSATGSLSTGRAGSIQLASGRLDAQATRLQIDGVRLAGFDFGSGGRLTLGTPGAWVAAAGQSAPAGFAGVHLSPEFFSAGGFGSITLGAFGDIVVAAGTQLAPTLSSWLVSPGYRRAASGRMRPEVATAQPVDEALADRQPVNLSMTASRSLNPEFGSATGRLQVERGAAITLEAGATLALSATGQLEIGTRGGVEGQAARLEVPGGTIRLGLTGNRGARADDVGRDPVGFIPGQATWIGADAVLSVSGTAELRLDRSSPTFTTFGAPAADEGPRQTGRVLGGGSIEITNDRGYVVLERGSRLELDGAAAALQPRGAAGPLVVAQPPGRLSVASPEGIVLEGTVSARVPRSADGMPLTSGGSLTVALGVGGVLPLSASTSPFPTTPREIRLGDAPPAATGARVRPGDDLFAAYGNGLARVDIGWLEAAGFDTLRFGAGDRIVFDGSMALRPAVGLVFDSPVLAASPGADVSLSARSIALGDRVLVRTAEPASDQALPDTSADQGTRLSLQARTIEVVGRSALQGFSSVHLDAGGSPEGEVRFSAVEPVQQRARSRSEDHLRFAGELRVTAGQVFATTTADFTLQGLPALSADDPGSRVVLRTAAGGAAPTTPLSAFGRLAISATDIDQGGVLRQPFGRIELDAARTLTLGSGSITSVSGAGQTLLYGTTENLTQWLQPLFNNNPRTTLPVDKSIVLSGATIGTSPSAVVDAAGGGRILASEFFAGVGGSADVFDSAGLFAVLPDFGRRAPVSLGGGITGLDAIGREFVVSTPGAELPPGAYTVLPARLALLGGTLPKGAFLVRRATDQGSALLGAPRLQDDGSVVVSGTLRDAGSIGAGTPGERFVIESPSVFSQRSDVRLTDAGQLLVRRAEVADAARPTVPLDGGAIRVEARGSERSIWQSEFRAGAAGGRAGTLDIAATRLALLDDPVGTPPGTLGVGAATLSRSGAGSVLVGGQRGEAPAAGDEPVSTIDARGTTALTVALDPGRPLRVEELILASSGTLDIRSGSRLEAIGTGTLGARTLGLVGDGALAVVSANPVASLRTAAAGTQGVLEIQAGVELRAPRVVLDASADLRLPQDLRLETASLELGAPRLAVGQPATPIDPDAVPRTTVLAGALLNSVRRADDLTLRSSSSLDFHGVQDWAQRASPDAQPSQVRERLVLDAPTIRGVDGRSTAGDAVPARTDIAARELVLRNSRGGAGTAPAAGTGELTLQALPRTSYGHTGGLTVGPGTVQLGFDQARLLSLGDLVLDGTGGLSAQADLTLLGARLTATTAARHTLAADAGTLRLGSLALARTLGERVGQGAELGITARHVVQDGRLELPSGGLSIDAAGSAADTAAVRFGDGSSTSVAGFSVASPSGFEVDGAAGRIAVTARSGAIELLGRIDASVGLRADGRPGEGDAGSIELRAAGAGGALVLEAGGRSGTLQARGGRRDDDRGGTLRLDVQRLDDSAALLATLATGGIDHELDLRVRSGDLTLAAPVQAERLRVAADGGTLRLTAPVDARAGSGGVVQLAARDDVVLGAGARIDARSTSPGASGGDVLLAATTGRVRVAPDATIDTRGDDADDGRIVLRAPRTADAAALGVDRLTPANLQAAEISLEAVRVYRTVGSGGATRDITAITTGNSSGSNLGQASVQADSAAFMAGATGALDALGIDTADRARFALRAGVEVQATGSLTLNGDWALQTARPGGEAGMLTLRAAGDLLLNGSISDGFAGTTLAAALSPAGRAWSYRLVAGADLSGAHPLTVSPGAPGTLTVSAGRLVRTGAGSIELAAADDVRLAAGSGPTAAAAVMVAGSRWAGPEADAANALFARQTARPAFTVGGGRLDIAAGGDVIASGATQLVNNWLWRSGIVATSGAEAGLYAASSHLGWWPEFSRFRQSLGAFGGASLRVRAGGDIVNLQALAPTAGWASNRNPALASLRTIGGGSVDIQAGGDVLGGQFLAGRGSARITALGSVGALLANEAVDEPILAQMGGASWRVQGRESVAVAASFNPTAVPVSAADGRVTASSFFYTWGDGAALSLRSSAGGVAYAGANTVGTAPRFGLSTTNATTLFAVMPASLELVALGGPADLMGAGSSVMFPSAEGQLSIWAASSVRFGATSSGSRTLAMADSAPSAWPDFSRPTTERGGAAVLTGDASLIDRHLAGTAAGAAIHAADPQPVQVRAEGSILQSAEGGWILPKAAVFAAGDDIVNLQLRTQHTGAGDRTQVTAGRNLEAGLRGVIELGGPGVLDVRAGREVDLGSSPGVRTIGNLKNAALGTDGASIRLAAGTAATLDLAVFEATYLARSERAAQYRTMLRDQVRQALADDSLDEAAALAQFRRFPADAQVALARQVLAAEFGSQYLGETPVREADVLASLREGFVRRRADILAAGEAALAAGRALVLPGRESLAGAELSAYLAQIRALGFEAIELDGVVASRTRALESVRTGWRDAVARSLGSTAEALDALAAARPTDAAATAWREGLARRSGELFERYREGVLESQTVATAKSASAFGRGVLPVRLALFDEVFRLAELTGAGSFVPQPVWPGDAPVLGYRGALEMTQSAVVTERGGRISLLNPGGGINVGLKVSTDGGPKGVITLGGGNVFGFARDDFQVNTQRVFVVGRGDMNIWSSSGDIDSGRGANTAVGAPPLAPRRSVDGVVFEIPATTTGSGLAIVPDVTGRASGEIGLFPAFGEILALDAFIRAPSIVLGATVKGADNLGAASVSGAAAPVAPPPATVATPPARSEDGRRSTGSDTGAAAATRDRNALLTVELLGTGAAEPCEGLSGPALDECRRRLATEPPRPRP